MSYHQPPTTIRINIQGRVQGVGYRKWVQKNAQSLELSGWVKNEDDGSVSALFHGPLDTVKQMIERCHKGPMMARVNKLETTPDETHPAPGFVILK
jgi:acylphosphatase